MDSFLAQAAASFATKWCHGSFPDDGTGSSVVMSGEKLCTVQDLIAIVYLALNFVVTILAPIIVVVACLYGGALITLYGVNPANLKRGKDTIRDALIGLVIVWGAWIAINGFFSLFGITLPCGAKWYQLYNLSCSR